MFVQHKLLTYIAAIALLAYNIVSIGLAYRAGQQSILDDQLKTALVGINDAIEQQKIQIKIYEQLSVDFAATAASQQTRMRQTEDTINDYLQTIESNRMCIEPDAVRLLNDTISTTNATTAPNRGKRPYPLRATTTTD